MCWENIAVENQGYLVGINADDKTIMYSNNREDIGRKASSLGLKKATYTDGYSGYQTVNSQTCFVTTNVYNDSIICVVVPLSAIEGGRFAMTLVVTLISLFVILIISATSLIENMNSIKASQNDDEEIVESEHSAMIEIRSRPTGEVKRVQTAASRWANQKKIPWKECTADERLLRILKWIAGIAGILLVIYVYLQRSAYDPDSILSYIIHKRWEKVPNLFSFTYIAIVMLEVVVASTIVRKIIMLVTASLGTRAETIGRLLDSFIKYISVIGGVFYCMNFVGVDSSTLLASAGLLSVIVGLGAQSLISDILAGIFIVFEGEFRVGDIVTIDTWRGTVLEIGVRATKIEDPSGNIKILNNSKIVGVINMTKKYSFASCDVGLEYDESLERVESILKEELPHVKERLPAIEHGPYYRGVVQLADSSVIIRIVAQCQETDRVQLMRDMNREIKVMFDRRKIGIAYPQVVVHEPAVHSKATKKDKETSEQFVKDQKEETSNMVINDND